MVTTIESRMVGDRLYLSVTQKWEKDKIIEKGWGFSYSTRLQSFDLTEHSPEELSEQIIPGSAEVINANNSSLLVVTRGHLEIITTNISFGSLTFLKIRHSRTTNRDQTRGTSVGQVQVTDS